MTGAWPRKYSGGQLSGLGSPIRAMRTQYAGPIPQADERVRHGSGHGAKPEVTGQAGQSEWQTVCQVGKANCLGTTAFASHPNSDPTQGSVGGPRAGNQAWGCGKLPGLEPCPG